MNCFVTAETKILRRFIVMGSLLLGMYLSVYAQPDAPLRMAPLSVRIDSCYNPATIIDPVFQPRLSIYHKIAAPMRMGKRFYPLSSDEYFYFLAGLLILLGFGVKAFPKYLLDISRLLFQDRFSNKSVRDQLMQNKQASLFLNLFFFLAGGCFLYLVGGRIGLHVQHKWYFSLLFFIIILAASYLFKFLVLYLTGWLLGLREQMNAYIFIEFFMNKVVGLTLMPMVIFLWLGREGLHPYFMTITIVLICTLFIYRYRLLFPVFGNIKRVSLWHFFIYLCALEFVPLLIIAKILSLHLNG